MKLIACFLLIIAIIGVKVQAASVVKKAADDLFPLSIIHLNDFHAR